MKPDELTERERQEIKANVSRLGDPKEALEKAYNGFEFVTKLYRDLQKQFPEGNRLAIEDLMMDQIRQMIHDAKSDETDAIIKPTSDFRILRGYSVPDLRQIPLDDRLKHISEDSNSVETLIKEIQTSIERFYQNISGGEDQLQPGDSESKHFLIGIAQTLDKKIYNCNKPLRQISKQKSKAEQDEREQERKEDIDNSVDLINGTNLPINEESAEMVYNVLSGNFLERVNNEVIYAAISFLRESDPDKALNLAKRIRDRDMMQEIRLKNINNPRPLVKLITSPDTKLAKRIPQYNHPAEFDFDAPLSVLVGPNGSGKSSVMKSIAGVSDKEYTLANRNIRQLELTFGGDHNKRQNIEEQEHNPEGDSSGKDVVFFRPDIHGKFIPAYVDMMGTYNNDLIRPRSFQMSAGQAQLAQVQNLGEIEARIWTGDGYRRLEPGLLFLDEIGNQVDPTNSKLIAESLSNSADDMQIVIATHNPNIVKHLRPDAILYSMSEVRDGMPVQHRISELDYSAIEKLVSGGCEAQ